MGCPRTPSFLPLAPLGSPNEWNLIKGGSMEGGGRGNQEFGDAPGFRDSGSGVRKNH